MPGPWVTLRNGKPSKSFDLLGLPFLKVTREIMHYLYNIGLSILNNEFKLQGLSYQSPKEIFALAYFMKVIHMKLRRNFTEKEFILG